MARPHFSLRSAHLVMWSSPLLLLVLLFTVTANTTPSATHGHGTTTVPSTVPTPTTTMEVTTTTSGPATTTTVASRGSSVTSSSGPTVTSAPPTATASNVSVASGALSGALTPGFNVADVPMQGPGTWTLTSSSPVRALLACPMVSGPVTTQVVIAGAQSCQLQLTSMSAEVAASWQLTPIP